MSSLVVDAEQTGGRVEHPGRVQRADQRQEPAGRVGEAGHRARSRRPAGTPETLNTVPDVPIDTITSPGRRPAPSAAAALSPAPGPSMTPAAVPRDAVRRRVGRTEHAGHGAHWPRASVEQVGPVRAGRGDQ